MRGPVTPAEFVPMWMKNHGVSLGRPIENEIIQMLKDFMSDMDSPVRMLVQRVYQDPEIPEHPKLLVSLSDSKQQAFKNGYYSVRDLEEFQSVAKLTKRS